MQLRRLTILLVVMAMLLACIACNQTALNIYSDQRIQLTDADRDALVKAARGFLTQEGYKAEGLSAALTQPYEKDVFVTVFAPRTKRLRSQAAKGSVIESLETACNELRQNSKFKSRFADQMEKTTIAIHIIDEVAEIPERKLSSINKKVEPGINGMILEKDGKRTFQLGEDVIFNGWGMKGFGDKDRVSGKKMTDLQLKKLSKEAGLAADGWKEAILYSFTVHPMVETAPGGPAYETYRAMRLFPKELTRKQVLESAWLAANNLAMHTNQEGKLGYHYMAATGEFTKGYNIVRHAGSVWGLFTAYKATGDVALLEAGRRALEYLGKSIIIPPENSNVAFLDYKGQALLGTNALAAMSLAEIPQELLDEEWKTKREKLGNGLIAFQVEDGRFYTSWDQVQAKKMPKEQAMYFPGEAFLAFMKLYDVDPQQKWIDHAKLCAARQMDDFEKNPSVQPDAWVVQALCKLYRVAKDERIPKVVFKMVEWHFKHQWGMPEKMKNRPLPFEDYFGGADNSTPPRSTPTSARNEANVEAWLLAKFMGEKEMEKKLGQSVMAAIWHNIVDQMWPSTSYWAPRPEMVLGGIRGSLITGDVRIDYNQHYLSAALNALELAEELYGDGELSELSRGKILDVLKLGIKPDEAAKQLGGQPAPAPAQ